MQHGVLDEIMEEKEDISGQIGGIQTESGVQLLVTHHCQLFSVDVCAMVM